eukprot:750493-Hanusia_phi.AAC.1
MEGQRSAGQRSAGSSKKRGGGRASSTENGFLAEMGLGCGPNTWKTTTACVCVFVVLTVMVTAWMDTCVPFCGAKVKKSGLWKEAWKNQTIPSDMQSSMDTSVDPCDDFYKFACGGFMDNTGIKPDQASTCLFLVGGLLVDVKCRSSGQRPGMELKVGSARN